MVTPGVHFPLLGDRCDTDIRTEIGGALTVDGR